MRKLIITVSLIIITAFSAFPQESSFYDAPFGGGGGYTPFWFVPDMNAVNTQVKAFGVPAFPKSGMFVSGGGGFIYLGVVKNLRIGGMGFGGSSSNSSSIGGVNKEIDYSLSGGGLTVEYTIPYINFAAVSVGVILGRGSLEISEYSNNGSQSWNNLWSGNSTKYNSVITNKYWIVNPTVNVDIPAYRMLAFRIGVGYQFALGNKWTYDNGQDLSGVPSGINGNSFFIQTGVFVGLFSF